MTDFYQTVIERSNPGASSDGEKTTQQSPAIRPKRLADYVGQTPITKALSLFIEAAKARQESLDHVLFFGPPGLGKTTLAQIIAHEMQSHIKQTSGPVLEKPGELAALLSNLEAGDVLFIDEIHRLHPSIEEILYPAMEDCKLELMIGEGPAARSIQLDLPPFTLIGATTKAGNLTAPLRARFGMAYRLEFYNNSDLSRIIQRSAALFDLSVTQSAAELLASRSRGTPRIANRLLRRVRDFAQTQGAEIVDCELITASLDLLGIDQHGFDSVDRKYMHTLCVDFQGGPAGVDSLAVAMGDARQTVEDLIEPFFIQEGYVIRTARGRVATDKLKSLLALPE